MPPEVAQWVGGIAAGAVVAMFSFWLRKTADNTTKISSEVNELTAVMRAQQERTEMAIFELRIQREKLDRLTVDVAALKSKRGEAA